ncbi:MAG: acyltransferase [Marinilabiliales bacterium]|nr:MAG: acyltransferase [Marinilabiliales bacterium]
MHRNNFDFLRLIFAIFVVLTHSFVLSGLGENDWLSLSTSGRFGLSYIGVASFFVISGYLIFQSAQRSKNLIDYFRKRILRIFPALIIVLIFTLILALVLYDGSGCILTNRSFKTYLPNNLSLFNIQMQIDGVFQNNPYKPTINGCLWTLRYEFLFYILSAVFIFFRRNSFIKVSLIFLFVLLWFGRTFFIQELSVYGFYSIKGYDLLFLGTFYTSGALLAAFEINQKIKPLHIIIFSIFFILTIFVKPLYYFHFVSFPLFVISFGAWSTTYVNNIGKSIGDLSYGIYIYGFPVQQTLLYYFNLNYLELFIYSLIITACFAYLSWHIIEKQALKLKKLYKPRSATS